MTTLWLEVKRFYVEPDDPDRPIIVVGKHHVLDVNHTAECKGIRRGMHIRQARALADKVEVRSYQREDFEERYRLWLDLCLDYSGVVQPCGQHAAWVDLSSHPNPTDIAERLVRDLAAATGRGVECGIAGSCWVARLAARSHDWGLALRDPAAFLSPLPVSDLLPVAPEDRVRLRFLGYPTIGSVAVLPLPVLSSQFGDLGLLIRAAAKGGLADPVIPTYPPNHLVERFLFDSPTDRTEDVAVAAKHIAEALGRRLQEQDREAVRVRFTVETEEGVHHTTLRTFPHPLHHPATVHAAMRALLKKLPAQAIVSLQLMLLDLELIQAVEKPILEEQGTITKWTEMPLRHLKEIFGDQSICRASQIELPRRVRVLQEWKNAIGWR
jgi:nucleotidyltransferase/DNA polymerase involved in DNA repair